MKKIEVLSDETIKLELCNATQYSNFGMSRKILISAISIIYLKEYQATLEKNRLKKLLKELEQEEYLIGFLDKGIRYYKLTHLGFLFLENHISILNEKDLDEVMARASVDHIICDGNTKGSVTLKRDQDGTWKDIN